MMKKGICLLLALCCALVLTGCTGRQAEEDKSPVPTLKPAEARYTAPDGDGIVAQGREYRMYLPARDNLLQEAAVMRCHIHVRRAGDKLFGVILIPFQ